ncbi:MAG: RDD family protein [Weeksellaceae bacterium]|nr:RDD family protein [Weeksellaceae bacterium]
MRTLNFVIDTITLVSIILLLWWGYLKLVPDNRVNDELNIILQLLAILAISGIYYTFLEYKYQRTVGKWITNTIVFNEYCERPSLKQIIRRTFLRAWSIFFLRFNLLYYLNDEGHCREYHDRSSNTWVVSMKEYREIKELLHEQNINEDNV